MTSDVYFINLRASYKESLFKKLALLLDKAGLRTVVQPKDLVAVKLHFGETGNTGFVRPHFLREIVRGIKALKGVPFLTDANTLYAGTRGHSPDHIVTALKNGFSYATVEAPIIIADGLRGRSQTGIAVERHHFETVYIGSEIVNADVLISIAHFKGHELCGFGGTLKNVGMGCASRHGKMAQHAGVAPKVKTKRCIGCGDCIPRCSQGAIRLFRKKARIDPETCIGCGDCILVCEQEAIQVQWNKSVPEFMEKMVEYTEGALKNKRRKALFVNFLTDLTPGCDCLPYSDAPFVADIGILASSDPVAVDQAAADLVNQAAGLTGSRLDPPPGPGKDKFRALYPKVDWTHQLTHAEALGLGSCSYRLTKIDSPLPKK